MKSWAPVIKNLSMLSQLGLSFITPLLLCLGGSWWLTEHMGVGQWIYFCGFFFGLGGSFSVAWKFYQSVVSREKKRTKKVSFNKHL